MNLKVTISLFKYVLNTILFLFAFTNISCNKSIDGEGDLDVFENIIETGQLPYISVKSDEIIQNEPKVPGDLYIKEYDSITHSSPIGIEYRGSTSFRLTDKKNIEFKIWIKIMKNTKLKF